MPDLWETLGPDELMAVVGRPVIDALLLGRVAASILTATPFDDGRPSIERDVRLLSVAAATLRLG